MFFLFSWWWWCWRFHWCGLLVVIPANNQKCTSETLWCQCGHHLRDGQKCAQHDQIL